MPAILPTIAAVASVAGTVRSFTNSGASQSAGNTAAGIADPAMAEHPFYQQMLRANIGDWTSRDPSTFLSSPFAKAISDQVTRATNRQGAAGRMSNSGNILAALQDRIPQALAPYWQSWMQQGNQNSQLMALLGGFTTAQPGTAAQASWAGNAGAIQAGNNAWGSLPGQINSLGRAWNTFGNNGGSNLSGFTNDGTSTTGGYPLGGP